MIVNGHVAVIMPDLGTVGMMAMGPKVGHGAIAGLPSLQHLLLRQCSLLLKLHIPMQRQVRMPDVWCSFLISFLFDVHAF